MGDMLDNRSFEEGGLEETSTEETSTEDVTTSEENTEATTSGSKEENNTEDSTESGEDNVEETTNNNEEETQDTVEVNEVKPTRAAKRVQKLLEERRRLREQLEQKEQVNRFEPNEEGEIEMTPDQLNEIVSHQVQSTLQRERAAQLEQEKANAWDDDIAELMEKNPELDPNSKKFNQELSDGLVELIRVTNTDEQGNPVINKLPSEVYATINKTLSAAKKKGQTEASVKLAKKAEETAVQSTGSTEAKSETYTDEQITQIQMTDPKKYAELIENNII